MKRDAADVNVGVNVMQKDLCESLRLLVEYEINCQCLMANSNLLYQNLRLQSKVYGMAERKRKMNNKQCAILAFQL